MKSLSRRIRLTGLVTLLSIAVTQAASADVDILIKNARVVDGTGSPWFVSDVAVNDGHIVAIGKSLDLDATEVIDARGRVLAPGFIDVHTHVESSDNRGGLEGLSRADNFTGDGGCNRIVRHI